MVPLEAKYIVRFVLGQLRLGVREMTLLDALARRSEAGRRRPARKIEDAFNLSSDLGLVAVALVKHGLERARVDAPAPWGARSGRCSPNGPRPSPTSWSG